jgi:hypothetical protein
VVLVHTTADDKASPAKLERGDRRSAFIDNKGKHIIEPRVVPRKSCVKDNTMRLCYTWTNSPSTKEWHKP